MKFLYSFIIVCALALVGCSKDNPADPGTNPTADNVVKATINGSAWSSTSAVVVRNMGIVGITGTTNNQAGGYQIAISLFKSEVGTYDLGQMMSGSITIVRYNNGSASSEASTAGTVTITTSNDQEIIGTFSCNAGVYTVTNGSFKVKF